MPRGDWLKNQTPEQRREFSEQGHETMRRQYRDKVAITESLADFGEQLLQEAIQSGFSTVGPDVKLDDKTRTQIILDVLRQEIRIVANRRLLQDKLEFRDTSAGSDETDEFELDDDMLNTMTTEQLMQRFGTAEQSASLARYQDRMNSAAVNNRQ